MKLRRIILVSALLATACAKEAPLPEPEAAAPPVYTLVAGFAGGDPETRSRLSFDPEAAQVLWSSGDAFKMIQMTETGYRSATYTTEEDGVTQATFTSTRTLSGNEFTSGYPASVYRVGRKGEMGCYLITPVPSEQEAVPGGIAEGLNRAAAFSDRPDADLTFYNLLSIIRFRVEGEAVSTLASVTFEAGTTVAGDATAYFEDGAPVIDFSKNWSNATVPRSTSVTLSGDFEAGQDYCIALVPAQLNGFTMFFRDGDGNTLRKHSSKTLALSRSRIVDLGTIRIGDTWEEEIPSITEYVHQTKGTKKNIIAVLADGFTASELGLFDELAKSAIDYMFSVEPYRTYKDYFTVYICPVASNESGAGVTDGDNPVTVDNYFGSRWGESSYSNMTANSSVVQTYLRNNIPEIVSGEFTYQAVPTLLLINDNRYGGICHSYSSGWSYCQVPYQYAGRSIRWSFPKYQAVNPCDDSEGSRLTTDAERDAMGRHVGDWRNTVLHEFAGHGYGRLSDEYWKETTKYTEPGAISGHSYTVPYSLNASGFYDAVPWQADLLDHLDEWVARNPDYGRVGIFHGAQTSLYYRWRPEMTSCMIDNRPYFNLWSRILIVRRILEKAGVAFDMDDFIAKDVTTDPIRPAANASPAEIRMRASRAALVPEAPMLPPPIEHEDE